MVRVTIDAAFAAATDASAQTNFAPGHSLGAVVLDALSPEAGDFGLTAGIMGEAFIAGMESDEFHTVRSCPFTSSRFSSSAFSSSAPRAILS